MTFTLDERTAERIDRTAERLGIPKSGVVREAVREYAARAGSLSEGERLRLLDVFDTVVGRIPRRPAEAVDREIAAVRRARHEGGRRPRRPEELAAQEALFPRESAIPFGPSEAATAADLYRRLSGARGREIDLAIAACAIGWDARLWTLNVADFEDIPGLELYRPA